MPGRRGSISPRGLTRRAYYTGGVLLAVGLIVTGLVAGDPRTIPQGLWTIFTSQGVLITDYMALAGPAAAFANAGLVTLMALAVMGFSGAPVNGVASAVLGLTSGFALFGKNPVNMAPILLGTWLYAKLRRKPFRDYAAVGLMATALGPMVSFFALDPDWGHRALGVVMGVLIGLVLPELSAYTFKLQNGMNLYNMGFACGLFALVTMPVMTALGRSPTAAMLWSGEYALPVGIFVASLSVLCIVVGTVNGGRTAWRRYGDILRSTGRAPSDYLLHHGGEAVLLNIGVNGLVCLGYVLAMGWDLNGPMLGAILTVMGFSAYGAHWANMLFVMLGVSLGGGALGNIDAPAVQMAGLFGTCLAPVCGCFGWPVGILAGFLHSAIVLRAGLPAEGVNLYNNGFSAGLLAIVLYAVLTPLMKGRRPVLQERDYMETVLDEEEEDLSAAPRQDGDRRDVP